MKLYKYYSYYGGLAAIESRQYGFREPQYFNDPFEITYLINLTSTHESSLLSKVISDLRSRICILCLTTSPLNPLMWAHYGDSHKGFVVEYDVDDEFLTSEKYNLVPVHRGSVIYESKDSYQNSLEFDYDDFHQVFLHACGSDGDRVKDYSKVIEHLYLTKSKIWSYEDEVRVVKLVDSLFEETHVFQDDPMRSYETLTDPISNKPGCANEKQLGLKLFDMHEAKIASIYVGANNPLLADETDRLEKLSAWKAQGIKNIFQVQPHEPSWLLHSLPLSV